MNNEQKEPKKVKCLAPHPPRRDPFFLTPESVAFFFIFFFIIPGILSDLDILFSNSLVSWLRLEGRVWEIDCGGRKKVQKGKMLT